MTSKKEKYTIKIPKDTTILYCEKQKILTLVGPAQRKSIKPQLKLLFNKEQNLLKVSSKTFVAISNNDKKNIKTIRGTTVALIKQLLIETSTLISQKLRLHGMGYRVSLAEILSDKVLTFKLGHSHLIFFKVPAGLSIFCFSRTKLCLFGHSYQDIKQTAAFIRSCRSPEPYKGKGVLYDEEKITLKEGKKV